MNGYSIVDVTIPKIMVDSSTASAVRSKELSETPTTTTTSRLIWTLIGVFLAILACGVGFGVVCLKQIIACNMMKKTEHQESSDEEAASQDEVQMECPQANEEGQLRARIEPHAVAETGIPLTSAYKAFNQDDVESMTSHATRSSVGSARG